MNSKHANEIDKDERRKETTNWSKATLALKIAKVSVCPYITEKYEEFLLNWSSAELEHLPHFFSEVDADAIHYEMKMKEWKIKTTCQTCPTIFDKILQKQRNPKSRRLVWKPNKKETKYMYRGSTLVKTDHFDGECNICFLNSCIFNAEREGIALDERKQISTNQDHGHTQEALDSIAKYYWRIGNMFMFKGNETDLMTNTSPGDTDPALVFKMMMNCTLFENDDELYNEVMDARNYLMHTSSQRIPKDDFDNCIEVFTKFITQFEEKCYTCIYGNLEIMMLLMSPEITIGEIKLHEQAFKIQKDAITYDINISGRLDISAHMLQSILTVIDSKITHSNYTADTDEELRDENEQLRQDLSAQRNEHYKSSAENQDLRKEIQRLRRLITDMQSEINEKTQNKSTPKGGDSGGAAVVGATGGATTGAAIGAIAGPPGMIIGGAVGALFGGIGGILGSKI